MAELDDALASLFAPSSSNPTPPMAQPGVTAPVPDKPIASTPVPNQGPAPAQPKIGPSDASQTGNVVDAFTAVPQLAKDQAAAQSRASSTDDFIQSVISQTPAILQDRTALLAQKVAAEKTLNDSVQSETQAYAAATAPIFQKRIAIAGREAELAQMNPIARMVAGIFSQSHNQDYLDAQDAAASKQLQALDANHQAILGIHDTVAKVLTSNYENQDAIDQLKLQDNNEQVRMGLQGVASANQVVDTQVAGLKANEQVLRSQALARQQLMDSLTHGQINQAYAQATKQGGTTVINGTPVNAGELKTMADNWSQKELALESANLSVQNGRLDLANAQQNNYLARASQPEIEAIIARGGKSANGVQFSNESLAMALKGVMARNQAAVDSVAQNSQAGIYASTLLQIGNNQTIGKARAQDLFGTVPTDWQNFDAQTANRLRAMTDGLKKAQALGPGAAEAYMAEQVGNLAGIAADQRKVLTGLATQWAGGSRNKADFASAYLLNNPLNAGTSAAALAELARDGIPAGTKLSPTALASLSVVKPIVDNYYRQQSTAGFMGTGIGKPSKFDKGTVPPELIAQITAAVQGQYAQTQTEQAIKAAPAIARTITMPDGTPHPFSRVNPADIQIANTAAGNVASQTIAQTTGIPAAQVETMLKEGANGPTYQKYFNTHGWSLNSNARTFADIKNQYASVVTGNFLTQLDHTGSAQPGFKPSSAFIDLINNSDYQQKALNMAQNQSTASAGDYAVQSIGGTNYASALFNHADNLTKAYGQNSQAEQIQRVTTSARLRNSSPVDAATLSVHSLPNLSYTDGDALLNAVLPVAADQLRSRQVNTVNQGDAIDNVIMNHRFADPKLEAIRQRAARDWLKVRQSTDKGLAGMFKGISAGPTMGTGQGVGGIPTTNTSGVNLQFPDQPTQ